jgi:phenylalanine-4-hydroxylase
MANENAEPKNASKSAYEKAADGGSDPRCIPQTLGGPPPVGDEIPYPDYKADDHEIWKTLFERQTKMLPGRAGEAYLNGIDTLGMTAERIPSLRDLSQAMEKATGWTVARIPGLLHERDFFTLLSKRIFPSTDYIRQWEELDYTPAPDCFHDIFGHMPMLSNQAFADFYHDFGKVALNAEGVDRTRLERFHWFTVEFGLIKQAEGTRIFGAGILSSKEEVGHALGDEVKKIPFTAEKVTNQDYDVWHLQPLLFVLESFEQLVTEFRSWAKSRGLA